MVAAMDEPGEVITDIARTRELGEDEGPIFQKR